MLVVVFASIAGFVCLFVCSGSSHSLLNKQQQSMSQIKRKTQHIDRHTRIQKGREREFNWFLSAVTSYLIYDVRLFVSSGGSELWRITEWISWGIENESERERRNINRVIYHLF